MCVFEGNGTSEGPMCLIIVNVFNGLQVRARMLYSKYERITGSGIPWNKMAHHGKGSLILLGPPWFIRVHLGVA